MFGEIDLFREINIYCERLDASFWAEPINAITNISFLIAAYLAWRYARRKGGVDLWTGVLIGIVVAIGIGSFLFHTVAQFWSLLADVIPITLFIYVYLFIPLRRFFKLGFWPAAGFYALLIAFDIFVVRQVMPPREEILWANGSEQYLFPLIAMLIFIPFMIWKNVEGTGLLAGAALVFIVSLTARTLDNAVCAQFELGTHFLWHIFNGLMLGMLLFLAIRHGPNRTSRTI